MARRPLSQLSPAYRRRVERAMARGKSRQEARGHRPGEARERAAREREEYGISSNERRNIEAFCERFNNPARDVEDVLEFASSEGYAAFVQYRETWTEARQSYLRELRAGSYASKGLGYLETLTMIAGAPAAEWLYYH